MVLLIKMFNLSPFKCNKNMTHTFTHIMYNLHPFLSIYSLSLSHANTHAGYK